MGCGPGGGATGACGAGCERGEERERRIKAAGSGENRELRQANEIPAQGIGGILRRRSSTAGRSHGRRSSTIIGDVYGVEPICRVFADRPRPTYHVHAARRADPGKSSARAVAGRGAAVRDPAGVGSELPGLRGAQRSGGSCAGRGVGSCPLHDRAADAADGVGRVRFRGRAVKTTVSGPRPRPLRSTGCEIGQFPGRRNRNALWVAGLHFMSLPGRASSTSAFIIDAFARRIIGLARIPARHEPILCSMPWRQALYDRRPVRQGEG